MTLSPRGSIHSWGLLLHKLIPIPSLSLASSVVVGGNKVLKCLLRVCALCRQDLSAGKAVENSFFYMSKQKNERLLHSSGFAFLLCGLHCPASVIRLAFV
jgi:hypothetical protein